MTTPYRRVEDGIYEQLARIGKATSSPERVELLDLLCQRPRPPRPQGRIGRLATEDDAKRVQRFTPVARL